MVCKLLSIAHFIFIMVLIPKGPRVPIGDSEEFGQVPMTSIFGEFF